MINNYNLLKKNENLTNYYYYSKHLTNEEIEKIIELSKKYNVIDGNVSGSVDYNYRKSKITWIPLNNETKFIYDKLVYLLKDANDKLWNFNITNLVDDVQITEYNDSSNGEEPGHYDWHMDFGTNVSTRKLSVSIQLTDENEYEGGDLELKSRREYISYSIKLN